MKIHVNINVRGKVQGVYFRASTLQVAKELSIFGTVCNERDGSVSIEAEGTKSQLEDFLKWCHSGPKNAVVKEVKITQSLLKNYSKFTIISN